MLIVHNGAIVSEEFGEPARYKHEGGQGEKLYKLIIDAIMLASSEGMYLKPTTPVVKIKTEEGEFHVYKWKNIVFGERMIETPEMPIDTPIPYSPQLTETITLESIQFAINDGNAKSFASLLVGSGGALPDGIVGLALACCGSQAEPAPAYLSALNTPINLGLGHNAITPSGDNWLSYQGMFRCRKEALRGEIMFRTKGRNVEVELWDENSPPYTSNETYKMYANIMVFKAEGSQLDRQLRSYDELVGFEY